MTNAIEVTKRKLYEEIRRANEMASIQQLRAMGLPIAGIEERLESHLEVLRQDRAALTTERDTLRNRVQVLEMANATSGEVIRGLKDEATQARRARMKARLHEYIASASTPAENVASAALSGNAGGNKQVSGYDFEEMSIAMEAFVQHVMRKDRAANCMHSFHPAFPSGELCTFCGVGK